MKYTHTTSLLFGLIAGGRSKNHNVNPSCADLDEIKLRPLESRSHFWIKVSTKIDDIFQFRNFSSTTEYSSIVSEVISTANFTEEQKFYWEEGIDNPKHPFSGKINWRSCKEHFDICDELTYDKHLNVIQDQSVSEENCSVVLIHKLDYRSGYSNIQNIAKREKAKQELYPGLCNGLDGYCLNNGVCEYAINKGGKHGVGKYNGYGGAYGYIVPKMTIRNHAEFQKQEKKLVGYVSQNFGENYGDWVLTGKWFVPSQVKNYGPLVVLKEDKSASDNIVPIIKSIKYGEPVYQVKHRLGYKDKCKCPRNFGGERCQIPVETPPTTTLTTWPSPNETTSSNLHQDSKYRLFQNSQFNKYSQYNRIPLAENNDLCVSKSSTDSNLVIEPCDAESSNQQFFNYLNYQIQSKSDGNTSCWEINNSNEDLQLVDLVPCVDYNKYQMFSYDTDDGSLHPSSNQNYCITKVGVKLAALPCKSLVGDENFAFGFKNSI